MGSNQWLQSALQHDVEAGMCCGHAAPSRQARQALRSLRLRRQVCIRFAAEGHRQLFVLARAGVVKDLQGKRRNGGSKKKDCRKQQVYQTQQARWLPHATSTAR